MKITLPVLLLFPVLAWAQGADFTIAVVPDPQYLAGVLQSGAYYPTLINWIINNRNLNLTTSSPTFAANIKAVIGVGDLVQTGSSSTEYGVAGTNWDLLDSASPPIAWTVTPGNHDYTALNTARTGVSANFHGPSGYFSADTRSAVYGSGLSLGNGDMAYWLGNFDDSTGSIYTNNGANTAVKFVISGVKMVVVSLNFLAGQAAWNWAKTIHDANLDCEFYINSHAWLQAKGGGLFQDSSSNSTNSNFGSASSLAMAPYDAWNGVSPWATTPALNTWSNFFIGMGGHDVPGPGTPSTQYYYLTPMTSSSSRAQTVEMLFTNSQQIDNQGTLTPSLTTGAGMFASVFLLSRRSSLGLLEGRMVSVQYGSVSQTNSWFETAGEGGIWSASEQLLFSIPFTGLPPTASGSAISGTMNGIIH
jgi:hypothetical protein